jgi:predicted outer membrane repeat protein
VQVWGGYPISGGDDASRNIVTNETILSGDIGAPGNGDNAYHVVLAMGVDRKTVLSGLTITGGNANVISIISVLGSNAVYRHYGGGIYSGTVDASRSYSPVLVNVKISGNSASHINSLGGGMYNDKAKPVLINVLVSGNTSSNRGGGIFNIAGSSLFLTNVTVSGNSATNNGGAIDSDSSSLTIWNSVVWGNSNGIGSPATISNSIVQGGWGGSNNQNVDPSFAGSGDYRLNGGSPAINAGDSGSYPDTWAKWSSLIGDDEGITTEDDYNMYIAPHLGKDLAGHTRIQGTAIDMGAYEKN